jgi:Spy/CpxP family protein refolding chaperone
MKRVILVLAVALSTISVFSQDGKSKKTTEQRAEMYVKELTTELSLTANQSSKIKAVQLESLSKLDSIKAKATDGDKKAGKKEAKAVIDAANASIKAILTDEQKPKFDAWVEARKEKMKNKNGGKEKEKKENKEDKEN